MIPGIIRWLGTKVAEIQWSTFNYKHLNKKN